MRRLTALALLASTPAFANMGATPDGTYRWSTSLQTADFEAPIHSFPGPTASAVQLSLGDDGSVEVSLNAEFNYFGATVTSIWVCSNGYISVYDVGCVFDPPDAFGIFAASNGVIAPMWTDLAPHRGGEIWAEVGNLSTTITWLNVPQWSNSNQDNPLSFQVRINHSTQVDDPNGITFSYGTMNDLNPWNTDRGPLVGIEDPTGGNGTRLFGHQRASVLANSTFDFDSCATGNNACMLCLSGNAPDVTRHADGDADGFGGANHSLTTCFDTVALGYEDNSTDCDDFDATSHPGADEVVADGIDQNCDAVDACYLDADGDGDGSTTVITGTTLACDAAGESVFDSDCDDNDANNSTLFAETCDGADNDCDTVVDNGLPTFDYYWDNDGDAFGGAFSTSVCAGSQPIDTVTDNTDCDDNDGDRFPGNPEACDGKDNDCDGQLPPAETDPDSDGVMECNGDNCPGDYNPSQLDADNDGTGNVCDPSNICTGPDAILENTDLDGDIYCAAESSITVGGKNPLPGDIVILDTGDAVFTAPAVRFVPEVSVKGTARVGPNLPAPGP